MSEFIVMQNRLVQCESDLAAAYDKIEWLTKERAHIIAERDKTFALMLERAEKAEVDAEFFKSEVKLRNRIPSTNDTAADLLRRAEKAEAERDSFQAMFRSCLKGNDALREKAQKANTERDEARAQMSMVYEVAAQTSKGEGESEFFNPVQAIRALTPADAKSALEAYGREREREGMRMAADKIMDRINNTDFAMNYHAPLTLFCKSILAEMEKLK